MKTAQNDRPGILLMSATALVFAAQDGTSPWNTAPTCR